MSTPRQPISLIDSLERVPVNIFSDVKKGSVWAAQQVAALIKEKQSRGENCVLGLATGSTPRAFYAELVRMYKEEGLSFRNCITFNLDEYYPIEKEAPQSYHNYMHRLFFNHVDVAPENIHIPNGALAKEDIKQHCIEYDKAIEEAGGIDTLTYAHRRNNCNQPIF